MLQLRKHSLTPVLSTLSSEGRFTAIVALCAVVLAIAGMIRLPPVSGVNDASRWDTVWSLTEGYGFCIDGAPYPTIDKVYVDGRFYSSKPQLFTALVTAIPWILRVFNFSLPDDASVIVSVTLFIVNLVPFALCVLWYGRWLRYQGYTGTTFRLSVLAAAFGTYWLSYNVTLSNHTAAATAVFFAIYFFSKVQSAVGEDKSSSFWTGVFCGLACVAEVHAALLPLVFGIWFAKCRWRQTLLIFLSPLALIGALYLLVTFFATGFWLPLYVQPHVYDYPGSYWNNPTGIDALRESKWIYAFNFIFGHHGLFSLTPVLVFSLLGWFRLWSVPIHRIGIICFIADFLFIILKTSNYGGVCQGPRFFMWLLPFFLLALPMGIAGVVKRRAGLSAVLIALAVSSFSVLYATLKGPWATSWLHRALW